MISNWTFSRFVIVVLLVALAALIVFTNFNYGKTMIVLQVGYVPMGRMII